MSNARIVSFSDPALRDKLTNLVRDADRPRLQTALNAELEIETPSFAKPAGMSGSGEFVPSTPWPSKGRFRIRKRPFGQPIRSAFFGPLPCFNFRPRC